ncbi:DUF6630 family protein [Chitinophaga arvensicola]|uniref:DUF6630 domain-containing protein n=1 Tax=Chitinophaga arvensicola TaxID=29529 RepID=A0A1I0RWB5_9BACT|nr:hypothetical protein [Chitinophaga arvensicola]SEW45656.1 hypothetical protein SAMN04488122_3494 [Chitinophaga arvensicola]
MNLKFVPYFFTAAEQAALPSFNHDQEVLDFLIDSGYLTVTDWKAEDEPYQIGHFIRKRGGELNAGATFDIESIYQLLQEQVGSMAPGDSIPFLLEQFQALVEEAGLSIVSLNRGNDSYYIGLVPTRDLKQLKKQSDDFWNWKAFGDLSGEVLYTVYCSCGSMNVWQVKRGDIITEDTCQDCGREIFDKEGKSTFEVIRDYI